MEAIEDYNFETKKWIKRIKEYKFINPINNHTAICWEDLFSFLVLANDTSKGQISKHILQDMKSELISYINYKRLDANTILGEWEKNNSKDLIACLELVLDLLQSCKITPKECAEVYFFTGGEEFFKKNKINYLSNEFLYEKFKIQKDLFCRQAVKKIVTYLEYNNFLGSLSEYKNKIKPKKHLFKHSDIFDFAADIEVGINPSRKDIFEAFSSVWQKTGEDNIDYIGFFCHVFVKTNFFKNSILPYNNIQKQLMDQFKPYMLQPAPYVFRIHSIALPLKEEDKVNVFINHPIFMQENLQKKLTKSEHNNDKLCLHKSIEQNKDIERLSDLTPKKIKKI